MYKAPSDVLIDRSSILKIFIEKGHKQVLFQMNTSLAEFPAKQIASSQTAWVLKGCLPSANNLYSIA